MTSRPRGVSRVVHSTVGFIRLSDGSETTAVNGNLSLKHGEGRAHKVRDIININRATMATKGRKKFAGG